MPTLRPEQAAWVERIGDAWTSCRSVLGVYPTGGGKTFCFSHIVAGHRGGSMVVAHRKKIVVQISLTLAMFGVKHRIIAPSHIVRAARRLHLRKMRRSHIDQQSDTGVASVQTLTSESSKNNPALKRFVNTVSLAVFDEGHHYVDSGQWAAAVTMVSSFTRLLFVTATPERCDGKGLGAHAGGFAEALVEGPPVRWQIENGRLSKYRYICPATSFDMSDVPVTSGGDFNRNQFRAKVVDSSLVGDVVQHYETHAAGRKAIVFATDVATAADMEKAFKTGGHAAKELNCNTDIAEAERALESYENGRLDVLINVDLFDEGFDVPDTGAVIMARPTLSLGKFLQQIGRALRTANGKDHAIIIDCVRNWERHGLPDWPRVWTLEGTPRRNRGKGDTLNLKVCARCTQPFEAFRRACPWCGHVDKPTRRSTPEHVGGDLFELDVEALTAVFDRVRTANQSAEDYERDLARRGCPAVGIARNVKIHNAVKYRRKVLDVLVSYWVGAQDGRDMGEIHRRFYYRFGVDIATAFALRGEETEALITRICNRFKEDLLEQ